MEDENDEHHTDAQDEVHPRHVNLSDVRRGGVADFHPRQAAELYRLSRDREHAGDHRLRGDDGGDGCEQHQRVMRPVRGQSIEGNAGERRRAQKLCALAHVVDEERGQHEPQPRVADRPFAEMAHIRVERFAARHREHDGAERNEPRPGCVLEQRDSVERVEREKHLRRLQDSAHPQYGEHEKPHHHDRAEQPADFRGATALHREEADQDDERQRKNERLERVRLDAQTFNGAEHRNRRRQHAVAEEEREAHDCGDADHVLDGALQLGRSMRERGQRKHAAFAFVVGAHDKHDVFDRDDQDERPDDGGERAHHREGAGQRAARRAHGFAHRIDRARADVAEDDAERAERQRCPPPHRVTLRRECCDRLRVVGKRCTADGAIHDSELAQQQIGFIGRMSSLSALSARPAAQTIPYTDQPGWCDAAKWCRTTPISATFFINSQFAHARRRRSGRGSLHG